MLKSIAYLLLGGIPAALLTSQFTGKDDAGVGATTPAVEASRAVDQPGIDASGAGNPLPAAYREASVIADASELESRLADAIAEPFSIERNARIEALFYRLAELDIRRALQFADVPGFDRKLVAQVFRAWARADREAALQQLAAVNDPESQIEIAVALLEVFGNDVAGIALVAASLPELQRIDFQAEALARRAEDDPTGALNIALGLEDPAARNTATQRIGAAWAGQDPNAAFARTDTLPPELRAGYRDSVAVEWARIDVSGFLDYADSLDGSLIPLSAGLAQAMGMDAKRLFEITARHDPVPIGPPFPANVTVESQSFSALINADPQWGVEYLSTIEGTQDWNSYSFSMAQVWGRTEPDNALAWAMNLDPPRPNLIGSVVWSASMIDIDKSIDWMLNYEDVTGMPLPAIVNGNLNIFVATDPRREELMNRLRDNVDNPGAQDLLTRSSRLWVETDPEGMISWMLEDPASVDTSMAAQVATRLATGDPALAASYLEQMPANLKGIWLEQVAAPYALLDPEAAAEWISGFRSEPNYETVVQRVVQMSAQTNPQVAARMLQVAPESIQNGASLSVAAAWAQQDLAGAGRWAAALPSEQARTGAVQQVANAWATRDPDAAQRWVLSLPRGAMRDQAVMALVGRFSRPDFQVPVDEALIDAIDNEQTRQQAASIGR